MKGEDIEIRVNGEVRQVHSGQTVADLLRELAIRPDRVAVELNLEIVDRQEFERRGLRHGDRVEIISFIGGGDGQSSAVSTQRMGFSLTADY